MIGETRYYMGETAIVIDSELSPMKTVKVHEIESGLVLICPIRTCWRFKKSHPCEECGAMTRGRVCLDCIDKHELRL